MFSAYRAHLSALADTWLAAGAQGFYLSCDSRVQMQWGDTELPGLAAPIQHGRETFGEIGVSGVSGHAAEQRLAADARLLAQLVARETELQQMTGEMVEMQDQLLAFYDLMRATRGEIGIVEMLQLLASETMRLSQAEGALFLMDGMQVQYPSAQIAADVLAETFAQVRASGHELVLVASGEIEQEGEPLNLCLLPMTIRDEVRGVLGLFSKSSSFSAPELKLARAMAEHASSQIEQALLHQELLGQARLQAEMEVARKVQLQMLPQHHPNLAMLDVYASSRPAREVGGDFYDFVAQPDRPLIAILGDVSGKGISAALIMGMIHAITNSAARFMPVPDPAAILSRANEYLYDDFTTLDTFATAFVCSYNPAEQRMDYANAGHAPVIFRPAGGAAALLEGDGVPVGVLRMSLSHTQSIAFGPGDILVVATDGFSEAANHTGEMMGYERLLELVDTLAAESAEQIALKLFDAVHIFGAGHEQGDDQTVIVIKGVER